DLDGDGPLHELEGVDVLELYPRTETFAPLRAQGHVRVAAKAALFHVAVVDADRHQDLAYGAHVGGGLLARSQIGLTHDLDERRSRTVQIDGRGALDPVQVLARVFFQVHTGNACGERRAIDLEAVLAHRRVFTGVGRSKQRAVDHARSALDAPAVPGHALVVGSDALFALLPPGL